MTGQHHVSVQAIGGNWPYVKWLVAHSADFPKIVTAVEAIPVAPDLGSKWAAVKAAGDIIVPDLVDFPGLPGGSVAAMPWPKQDEVDAAVAAHGEIIGKIIAALPQIMAFITSIWGMFPAKP